MSPPQKPTPNYAGAASKARSQSSRSVPSPAASGDMSNAKQAPKRPTVSPAKQQPMPAAKPQQQAKPPMKITKSDRQNIIQKIGDTVPITNPGTFVWNLSDYTQFLRVCELAVADQFHYNPLDFSDQVTVDTYPYYLAALKGYFVWALFTRLRKLGQLTFTTGNTTLYDFADFPDTAYLPNAIWWAIQYWSPYHEDGSEWIPHLNYSSQPLGTDKNIGTVLGVGPIDFSRAVLPIRLAGLVRVNSEDAVNLATSAVGITFDSLAENSALYSDLVESRGFCRVFSELRDSAPDGSAFAYINGGMVCSPTRFFNADVHIALFNTTDTVNVSATTSAQFRKPTSNVVTYDCTWTNIIADNIHAAQCFVWFANRHNYTKNDVTFSAYWLNKKMSTFVTIPRKLNLYGFRQLVNSIINYTKQDLGISVNDDLAFQLQFLAELALAAKIYCNTPCLIGRTVPSSGVYYDTSAYIVKSACAIKLPAIIGSYFDCIGVFVDENGNPNAFYPEFDAAANYLGSWWNISSTMQAFDTVGTKGGGLVRPQIATSAAVNFAVGGVTWNTTTFTAFSAANTVCPVWPQTNLNVMMRNVFAAYTAINGLGDALVSCGDKGNFAGRCTAASSLVKLRAIPAITQSTKITNNFTNECITVSSSTPLVGHELAKACLFMYTAAVDNHLYQSAKFRYSPPSKDVMSFLLDRTLTDTMQVNGAFQREIANVRASGGESTLNIGGMGIVPKPRADASTGIMDKLFANASELLGTVIGAPLAQDVMKVGGEVLPMLAAKGLKMAANAFAPALGTFIFG
jgi:hypothetical protein